MNSNPVRYIWCPGCDGAVREVDDTPCPNCQRCPFCGSKLKPDEHCGCSMALNSESIQRLVSSCGIPEVQVARELRRAEIRKELESTKGIVAGIIGGLFIASGTIFGALRGERTYYNMAASALISATAFAVILSLIAKVFRNLEDRRVDTDSPLTK